MTLEISRQILEKKKSQILIFFKIHPMGAVFLHADGRTGGQTNWHDEA